MIYSKKTLWTSAALFTLSSVSLAQEIPAPDRAPAQKPATVGKRNDTQQSRESIGDAFRDLRRATFAKLQRHSEKWSAGETPTPVTPAEDAADGDTDEAKVVATSARPSRNAPQLQENRLLVAMAPGGLLAGAPVMTHRMAAETPKASATPIQDRKFDGGDSVAGMLLVWERNDDRSRGIGRTDVGRSEQERSASEESGAPMEASGTVEAERKRLNELRGLEPGVYCIKRSGDSVWLETQSGMTVLRTTVFRKTAGRVPDEASGDSASSGSKSGELTADTAGESTKRRRASKGDDSSWDYIFGAITKEVMTSKGWDSTSGQ
ncbi:MAG: hypothetical protein KDC95_16660 [Planctomycetes bacterium]|nr:hypothetical protein [Planctomycetota bacterium]